MDVVRMCNDYYYFLSIATKTNTVTWTYSSSSSSPPYDCFTNSVGVVVVRLWYSQRPERQRDGAEWQFDGLFWIAFLWWWYGYDYFMHQLRECAQNDKNYHYILSLLCDWLTDDGHKCRLFFVWWMDNRKAAASGEGHLPVRNSSHLIC